MRSSILKTQENCEGSVSLTLRTRNLKKPFKNARKKLETSVAPAMPCKFFKKTCESGASNKIKTRLACILEGDESRRLRMGESLQIIIKTILQEKEPIHCSITIWFTNLFLCTKTMKNPAAKAAVDKECEKMEKISAWNLTKVKSKKQVIDEVRMSGATFHFCIIDGHMSFEKC